MFRRFATRFAARSGPMMGRSAAGRSSRMSRGAMIGWTTAAGSLALGAMAYGHQRRWASTDQPGPSLQLRYPDPSSGGMDSGPTIEDQDEAATKIQAAFRGYRERNKIDKDNPGLTVGFTAWRHSEREKQLQHLTTGLRTADYPVDRKPESGADYSRTYYRDYRTDGKNRDDLEPFTAKNKKTGEEVPRKYQGLKIEDHTPEEHEGRFLTRPPLRKSQHERYDETYSMDVHLSPKERMGLYRDAKERKKIGVFHVFGEAPDPPGCKTSRCMTPLELVAQQRKTDLERTNPEKATALSRDLEKANDVSPLVDVMHQHFPETTTEPEVKKYSQDRSRWESFRSYWTGK